jgi:hypothetical protein
VRPCAAGLLAGRPRFDQRGAERRAASRREENTRTVHRVGSRWSDWLTCSIWRPSGAPRRTRPQRRPSIGRRRSWSIGSTDRRRCARGGSAGQDLRDPPCRIWPVGDCQWQSWRRPSGPGSALIVAGFTVARGRIVGDRSDRRSGQARWARVIGTEVPGAPLPNRVDAGRRQ